MTAAAFLVFGKDTASLTAVFLIGLNVLLARKKGRLWALFLMVPLTGIINGLLAPLLLVPPYLLSLSGQRTLLYQYAVYGAFFLLVILFYVKGKAWRKWFRENMQYRSLRRSENVLLWVIGIVMFFFRMSWLRRKRRGSLPHLRGRGLRAQPCRFYCDQQYCGIYYGGHDHCADHAGK